jgi:NAD(P)H-flavin reductase
VFFARGRGVAVARAIVEATDGDMGSMNLTFRDEVRLFCSASKPSELAYQDKYSDWESKNVKVRPTVDDTAGEDWQGNVGSFTSVWDEDDLEYDPFTTGAVVCVEKESRPEVMELLEEAGIPKEQIVSWEF